MGYTVPLRSPRPAAPDLRWVPGYAARTEPPLFRLTGRGNVVFGHVARAARGGWTWCRRPVGRGGREDHGTAPGLAQAMEAVEAGLAPAGGVPL